MITLKTIASEIEKEIRKNGAVVEVTFFSNDEFSVISETVSDLNIADSLLSEAGRVKVDSASETLDDGSSIYANFYSF